MICKKNEVFDLIRSIVGVEAQSNISDRTINETISRFETFDLQTEENELSFWKMQAALLGETVKGQINQVASRVAKEAKEAKVVIPEEFKQTITELEELKAKIAKNEEEERLKKEEIELLKQWKASQDEQLAKTTKAQQEADRRKAVSELCRKKENGMAYEPILSPILKYFDYTRELSLEQYVEAIKAEYNETYSEQSKNGAIPLMSNGSGTTSDISDFRKKIQQDRQKEKERQERFLKSIS